MSEMKKDDPKIPSKSVGEKPERESWRKLLLHPIPWIVLCSADGAVAARRHLQRGLENPEREFYHGDKRVAHYRETGEISPPASYAAPKFNVPTIQVSTDGEYVPCIDEVVRQIQSSNAQQDGAFRPRAVN